MGPRRVLPLATAFVLLALAERHARAAPDAGSPNAGGVDAARAAHEGGHEGGHEGHDGDDDGAVDAGADASSDAAASGLSAPGAPPAAATVTLTGQVLERGTRRPLPGAAIAVDGAPAGETDADGRFELRVEPGPHRLAVRNTGYEDAERNLDTAAHAGDVVQIFRLTPRSEGEPLQTTVHARRPEIPHVEATGDEARGIAGSSGDPFRVLGSMPGVSQIIWPAALYVVRGANPGNTGFYLDGIQIPALFHLALGPSAIHPYLVAGVEFYPGGYPPSFGGSVSGIMAARTAAPPTDRVHGSADASLYDAGAIVTAPWHGKEGTIAVAARYSYTGALFSVLQSDSVLRYGDYQLRVDHPFAGGRATAFAFGSLDQIGWLNGLNSREYASLQFHRFDLRWLRPLGRGSLLAGVTLGADWSGSTLFDRPIHVRARSVAPRLVYDRDIAIGTLQVGGDANARHFDAAVPDFGRRPSDLGRSRAALIAGGWAELSLRLGRRLILSPGVRGDLFAEQGVTRVAAQPRLDLRYQTTDAIALTASAGRFAQMPSLPVSVAGFEAFGLADLGLQTALSGSIGVNARLPRDVSAGVTGFASALRLTDVRDIDLITIDPEAPDFLVSRRGRAYGVELLVRRDSRQRFYGWLAYTLSRSLREDDTGVLGRSDWDQRHILNAIAGYRMRKGYAVAGRVHFNTGRHAPIINSPGLYEDLPPFFELDLRVEKRITFDRFVLSIYADFANATLSREVVQVVQRGDGAGGSVPTEQSFRFVLPTVGLHAEL